jgi:hypothetical protein
MVNNNWRGFDLGNAANTELEDITLGVYLFVVKEGKPVGPRDVTKGANLSSPSVAYRHLQKLEELGLLRKNDYGEYLVKQKVNMKGFIWVGRSFVSKMIIYSLVFLAVLLFEVIVLAWHWKVETYEFKAFFFLLILITSVAMGLFAVEGLLQKRRFTRSFLNVQATK